MTRNNSEKEGPFALNLESTLDDILQSNREWSQQMNERAPDLFDKYSSKGQEPHTLLICCSDSRYNENCLNVLPGEVLTMKTIANICNEDLSFLATIEFAVKALKVSRIILMGHTDCGGIKTSMDDHCKGYSSNGCGYLYEYLTEIRELIEEKEKTDVIFKKQTDMAEKARYLSIEHILRQVKKIESNKIVQEAMKGSNLKVYGLLYNVETGLLDNCIDQ
ncbi:hypothetical protein Kpol_1003p29 [Vanderwaltozyma polyspora DSM 70294]|uniref:Carbonic anhydrase n=1 Tax=Vanderwaltozyma polyspora (strain ATCC 22028 / DSM 70294 / BCRC 21397 / CBS 2163 / NBRC 10782 / NRRL Y-8283 / UCD 57-17) TaxID=436907 RepID=A7TLY7_VANPO|nr:uncharacterized protein Kpol_1003p29 [Vanderwaltozyma polyspora DSM 70294]EDO16724.1 hypothetical protein Kpol_1003p29 [Vanderwaltozyma polyspora DSM 70294]